MKNQLRDLSVVKTILPIAAKNTSNGTGTAVGLAGFEAATFIVNLGVPGDTLSGSTYFTINFQDSDDGSTWTNIAAAELRGGDNAVVIDANGKASTVITRSYLGHKNFLRTYIVFTGTHTNGTPLASDVVLGLPRHAPVG